ncbi:MAG: hypothetical protein WC916_07110 [Candidatus Woesearchaeota archaeon]
MRLLRRQKKGNMLYEILLKVLAAIILILLLFWFLSQIWQSIFPGADKASKKSLGLLYDTINLKLSSNKSYDSSRMMLYLKTDYQIIIFEENENKMRGCDDILRPNACTVGGKQPACICLYSDDPDSKDPENDVIECRTFKTAFKRGAFELLTDTLLGGGCERSGTAYIAGTDTQFLNLIIAETTDPASKSKIINLWLATDTNIANDKKYKNPKCPAHSNAACVDKGMGEILTTSTATCQSSTQLGQTQCVYDQTAALCKETCINIIECKQLTECKDYVSVIGDGGKIYLLKDSRGYAGCMNDKTGCNVGAGKGCTIEDKKEFVCKSNLAEECKEKINTLKTTCGVASHVQGGIMIVTEIKNPNTKAECTDLATNYLDPIYGCVAPPASTP